MTHSIATCIIRLRLFNPWHIQWTIKIGQGCAYSWPDIRQSADLKLEQLECLRSEDTPAA